MGFEFSQKRSFNNIECTAGTVEQWKGGWPILSFCLGSHD
jgi:hypothetical protein